MNDHFLLWLAGIRQEELLREARADRLAAQADRAGRKAGRAGLIHEQRGDWLQQSRRRIGRALIRLGSSVAG